MVLYGFVLAIWSFLPLPSAATDLTRMRDGKEGVGREIVIDYCPDSDLPFCF